MNTIQTTFPCGSGTSTIATTCTGSETVDECGDRHDAAVARGKANCVSVFKSLGLLQTTWVAAEGTMLYASAEADGQASHDAAVGVWQQRYVPLA